MKRILIAFMIIGVLSGFAANAEAKMRSRGRAPASDAGTHQQPARSGTILTGSAAGLVGGEPLGCEWMADCLAWVWEGCDPDLAGRNPALMTSIEDVADLAHRSRRWNFGHDAGAAAYATVQLWGADCTPIARPMSDSGGCWGCFTFRIPPGTKWMTVTGYTYNPWGTWLPVPDLTGSATFEWNLSPYS